MRIALEVWSSDHDRVEATCLRAESLGVDAFYYGESPHDLNLDCWTMLGALARVTDRIRLGPVITNVLPSYRSTALLAKQAATVQSISGGRVDLRTGVGAAVSFARPWWEPFGVDYPDYETRLVDLEAGLVTMADLWAATTPPPITIAATGPRAMALAARFASVWETSFCTPDEFAERRASMTALVSDRPLTCSLEIDGFVGSTGAAVDRVLDAVHQDRSGEPLGPVIERALVGEPADVVERLDALAAVGVDQVVIALHDPHADDALNTVGEVVRLLRTREAAPEDT